jgi:hypothetical protein
VVVVISLFLVQALLSVRRITSQMCYFFLIILHHLQVIIYLDSVLFFSNYFVTITLGYLL